MLRIGTEIIERMIKVQIGLGPNPNTEVRVGCILGKLFVRIVRSLGTSKKNYKNPKREEDNYANTVAVKTVEDALVLLVHIQAND